MPSPLARVSDVWGPLRRCGRRGECGPGAARLPFVRPHRSGRDGTPDRPRGRGLKSSTGTAPALRLYGHGSTPAAARAGPLVVAEVHYEFEAPCHGCPLPPLARLPDAALTVPAGALSHSVIGECPSTCYTVRASPADDPRNGLRGRLRAYRGPDARSHQGESSRAPHGNPCKTAGQGPEGGSGMCIFTRFRPTLPALRERHVLRQQRSAMRPNG